MFIHCRGQVSASLLLNYRCWIAAAVFEPILPVSYLHPVTCPDWVLFSKKMFTYCVTVDNYEPVNVTSLTL